MKWIKLFEQYTQDDKVEAANIAFFIFIYNKLFNNIGLKKISNKKGETFYWVSRNSKPYLRIFMGSRGAVRFTSSLIDIICNIVKKNIKHNILGREIGDKALIQIFNKEIYLHWKYRYNSLTMPIKIGVSEREKFREMIPMLSESVEWNEK